MLEKKEIENLVRAHLAEYLRGNGSTVTGGAVSGASAGTGKRNYIVAANWKMNMSWKETKNFLEAMKKVTLPDHLKAVIFPPYPYLSLFRDMLRYDRFTYGGQDVAKEEKGAYTGEVSAMMLADLGCRYSLTGHSERRSYYGDTPEIVGKKTKAALSWQLTPMVCIGETLDERKNGLWKAVLKTQLDAVFAETGADIAKCVIAYEPVWAIGTGVIPTSQEILETHTYVYNTLASYLKGNGAVPPILYGGSVNEKNVREIAAIDHVGGFLIGGASLKADTYAKIISLVS